MSFKTQGPSDVELVIVNDIWVLKNTVRDLIEHSV